MSPSGAPDDAKATRDHIEWRQIFIGYGMVMIMLMVAVLHQLGFSENPNLMSGTGSVVVFAVVVAATVLAGPLKAFRRDVLAIHPALEDRLQWAAIGALVLLSIATIVHGVLVLPASGWS